MNVICSICSDQLVQSDDIFYTQCGHVFHLHCLTPWLVRSKSCPQCREKVTQSKIHRLYFTFSSNDTVESQGSTLQEKVDSLKFQIRLKEKDIQYYSSKSVTLAKQNVGLKQEVRKVESEITKKNSAIYALKEQMNYFKEQSDSLKREVAELKNKMKDLQPIQVLLHAPMSNVSRLVGKTKDPDILTTYISVMKKELIQRFDKCKQLRMTVKKLQEELSCGGTKSGVLVHEQSRQMDLEEKLAISESKNIALQERVDELEMILDINEKCNTVSEDPQTGSEINSSKESLQDTILKNDNEITSRDSMLDNTVKRKAQKIPVYSTKNIEDNAHNSQIANESTDSDVHFVNCNSSENSPVVSKKLRLAETDENLSVKSDKISSSECKKKRKHNVRKKVSDIKVNHVSGTTIDLT